MSANAALRWAWMVGGSLVTVVALVFGSFHAVSALAHEEETVRYRVDAEGLRALEVDKDAGATRIVGRDDLYDVRVTARISDGLVATDHGHRRTGDRLVIEASCERLLTLFCDADHLIEVPSSLTVVARNDGRTEITGVDGAVDVENDHASTELARITGDVRVRSHHGQITARDLRADRVDVRSHHGDVLVELDRSPISVRAVTDHGDVTVVVPDDGTAYRVETDTDHGAVDTPIRTDPRAQASITAATDHGDVTIRYAT